jgi:hypothetical protein
MATCGDALAPTRAAARTERLESLLRAHLARLAVHPGDLPVRREARAIARELKRRGDPAVNRGLAAAARARAEQLALDPVDPARTLEVCEAILVLDPDQPTALRLVAEAARAAGLTDVVAWATADLRAVFRPTPADDPRLAALVGVSPALRRARAQLSAALDSDAAVLLIGEPGTGKRLAATLLHAGGRAPWGPFQVLDAGLPEATLEERLFGRGDDAGALEQSGTLLLTNAQRLPPILQARLARTLRTREVQRSGDLTARQTAVPRLVLTAPPLAAPWPGPFVVDGLARALMPIELPPLRARPEDVAPLAAHLLRGARSKDGRPLRLREAALEAFQRHTWPGNVDELAGALDVLVKKHRWRDLLQPLGAVAAARAHPVESVHAALTAALDHLFDSVADEPVAAPPAPRDDLADRLVVRLTSNDVGGLAQDLVAAAERLGARWVALWRVDEAGRAQLLQLGDRALADPASAQVQVFEPAPAGSAVARAVTERRSVTALVTDPAERDLLQVLSAGGLAPRTLLSAPVLRGERALGVLLAADPVAGEFFTYRDLRALEALAAGLARGLDQLPARSRPAPPPAPEEVACAEPPVGWGPVPARPAPLRAPRFTHEGVAAAMSAAVVFTALMLGAAHVLGP